MQDKIVKHSPLPWWISFYRSFTLALTATGAAMIFAPPPNPMVTHLSQFRYRVTGVFFAIFGLFELRKTREEIEKDYYKTVHEFPNDRYGLIRDD
jgi:hypothetical protein